MRLGMSAQILEGNIIYVVFKHFIFLNRTVLVLLYRQNNIHASQYAASLNIRNQIISSEQT
jgi:hypothetical protein